MEVFTVVGWGGVVSQRGEWRVLFGLIDYHCWLWTVTWPLTPAERSPKNQVPHPLFFLDLSIFSGPVRFILVHSSRSKVFWTDQFFFVTVFFLSCYGCARVYHFFFCQTKIWKEKLFDTTIWSTQKKKKLCGTFIFGFHINDWVTQFF